MEAPLFLNIFEFLYNKMEKNPKIASFAKNHIEPFSRIDRTSACDGRTDGHQATARKKALK